MGKCGYTYLHYLSFMLAFGALIVESLMLKKDMSLNEAWKVAVTDAVYGLSATAILVTGISKKSVFHYHAPGK